MPSTIRDNRTGRQTVFSVLEIILKSFMHINNPDANYPSRPAIWLDWTGSKTAETTK